MSRKGQLYIVSGPSGSGKDTILAEVFKLHPEVNFSISMTSRPMRPGEHEGDKYHFVSREEFESALENDMLLEYNCFCGNYYGSPRMPIEESVNNGEDIILEIDVNGAGKVRSRVKDAVSVFIMPPSYDELYRRLSGRGTDSKESIDSRMNEALREISIAGDFDYIVINDSLTDAVNDLSSIITSHRLLVNNQKHIIDEVLSNVKSCNR